MLLIVQLVQITRGLTTYEAMSSHSHAGHNHSGAGEALSTFVSTGTTSIEAAQLGAGGRGPDPAVQKPPHKPEGACKPWLRMFGVDTFLATAMHGSNAAEVRARDKSNPFSRGWIQNFKDFFCDAAPIFGTRPHGEALLGGEKVDYTSMYELPVGMTRRRGGMEYTAVAGGEGDDENV